MKRDNSKGRRKNLQKPNEAATKDNTSANDRQVVSAAHEQAEKDMMEDAELTASSPNDDLDEGETARLGEDKTDII